MILDVDFDAALTRLMRFLSVEGVTGQEKAIGQEVVKALREVGVAKSAIHFDQAPEKIALPTQTGNLIVILPGTKPGPRRLFSTHLDTVPLCAGAVPVRKGNRIVPEGATALGGDNRTGVACLVTLIATLLEKKIPHGPLTFLFTVREESGLWGARFVDVPELGNPVMGFNVDGGSAKEITIGALGADRWTVEIFGKASHAGVHPHRGISATMVASLALSDLFQNGWFGRVQRPEGEGTSNVGPFGDANGRAAGQATNVVTDYVHIRGESRSHDAKFIGAITKAYQKAFQDAAKRVTNDAGKSATVKFTHQRDYFPFCLKDNSPVVKSALNAALSLGWESKTRLTNGGLDANWLTKLGIPTITFGAGQNNPHTVEEFVDLDQFRDGLEFALALAKQDS